MKESTVGYYIVDDNMPYNEFLKKLHGGTGISLPILHKGFVEYNNTTPLKKRYFTKNTVKKFISAFQVWMQKEFVKRFSYKRINQYVVETTLTDHTGNIKEYISQGTVGIHKNSNLTVPDTFLYDQFVYDSPKEMETIKNSNVDEVVVFGKIPKRSIQVPLYFGGTTSPDFMYVLKKPSGELEMNLIIETKDVSKDTSLRGEEEFCIECAKKFFETMKEEGINVIFKKQLNNDDIINMIEDVFMR